MTLPSPPIAQTSPVAGCRAREAKIRKAIDRVLRSGRYILGPEVCAFEKEWAAYLGADQCIGVANGTDAIEIALRAGGIGPGHVVFAPSHTAVATIAAIERTGARPCWVDIDAVTFTMDPDRLVQSIAGIEDETGSPLDGRGAIVPVHLYGHPANMPAILNIAREKGLLVVEDCAQAHGARIAGRRIGTWGDLGAFSFYPTKNLGALGDAGAVVTGNLGLAERIRRLREYGWGKQRVSRETGINSRLDEIQAAVLRVNLAALDADNDRRRRIAASYRTGLRHPGLTLPPIPDAGIAPVFHQFVISLRKRDALQRHLAAAGIGTGIHYPVPVHLQPAYHGRVRLPPGGLPVTETICQAILSLPIYPQLPDRDIDRVCRNVMDFLQNRAGA